MSYFPTPRGQQVMAESSPVVIASDQTPVEVNVSGGTVTVDNVTVDNTNLNPVPTTITNTPNVNANITNTSVPVTATIAGTPSVNANITNSSINVNASGTVAVSAVGGTVSTAPSSAGQKTMANSTAVVIASDQSAVPVSGTITTTPGTLGQQLMAASAPVVIASNQSAIATTVGNTVTTTISGTPTVNATILNSSINTLNTYNSSALGSKTTAGSLSIIPATDSANFPISGSVTATIAGTPTVNANITNSSINTNATPAVLGQKTMALSAPVVIASDQTALSTNANITNTSLNVNSTVQTTTPAYNLSSRSRSSRDFAIFEAKTIDAFPALLWEQYGLNAGSSYVNNHINMFSTAGGTGNAILQSRVTNPFLSAQTNWAEFSIINFQAETNIVKKIGMYSSNAVAPHQLNLDGFWIENDGTTIRFKVANNGTVIINTPIASWDNYAAINTYNFADSTIFRFSYLWNDCIQIQMFLSGQWTIVHTLKYSGVSSSLLWTNPYQYARCEIIANNVTSTFGLDIVDVTFGVDNLLENQTRTYSFTTANITLPTLTTPGVGQLAFALMKLQKTTSRATAIQLIDVDIAISTSDQCVLAVMIDPNVTELLPVTLSNQGSTEITVTAFSGISPVTSLKPSHPQFVWSRMYNSSTAFSFSNLEENKSLFSFLQSYLNQTGVPMYICAIPLTTNQVITTLVNVRIL